MVEGALLRAMVVRCFLPFKVTLFQQRGGGRQHCKTVSLFVSWKLSVDIIVSEKRFCAFSSEATAYRAIFSSNSVTLAMHTFQLACPSSVMQLLPIFKPQQLEANLLLDIAHQETPMALQGCRRRHTEAARKRSIRDKTKKDGQKKEIRGVWMKGKGGEGGKGG